MAFPATPGKRASRRAVLSGMAGASLVGLLSACGYGSQATSSDQSDAPATKSGDANAKKLSVETVKIGYFANLTHATALVGLQQGLLAKELGGTKIQTQVFNAGPTEIEALNAGAIDIGWIGPNPAINGYAKSDGTALRIISGSVSGGAKLVVNPAKIKTIDDLKGKRIATPQLGNTQDVAFLNFIADQGWKVDAQTGKGDVLVVRTENKVTPDAYSQGSLDGAWVPEPTASKLVSLGAKVLLDEKTLWPEEKFVTTHLIVSQKFLEDHADVVEAVLRGSVATNAWANANPDKAKAAANAKLKELSGKSLPPEVIDPAWQSIEITDDPLAASLQTEADHAIRAGLLKTVDLKGIYDLTLLNKVLKAQGKPAISAGNLSV
jgi:NitT/TauT family transport system substrate-binding protein